MLNISDGFNVKKNDCVECGRIFKTPKQLKTHEDVAHKKYVRYDNQNFGYSPIFAPDKNLSCVWCDVKFSRLDCIRYHTRSVHGFNCNDCMKELKTWDAFFAHAKYCKFARDNISYHQKKQLLK